MGIDAIDKSTLVMVIGLMLFMLGGLMNQIRYLQAEIERLRKARGYFWAQEGMTEPLVVKLPLRM